MPASMKNMIADTYQQLMERKSIDKITVKDLVEACGISRQTFYYHFKDIFEVIDWGIERKMEQVLRISLQQSTKEGAIRVFVDSAAASHVLISKGLNSQKREHIEAVLVQCLASYLQALFRKKNPSAPVSVEEEEMILQFCSGGIVHLLLTYCSREQPDTERLTMHICRLLSAVGDSLFP